MVSAWGLDCEVAVKMSAESAIIRVSDWAGGPTSKLLTHMTVGRKPQFLPEDLITGLSECLHNVAFVFSRVRALTKPGRSHDIFYDPALEVTPHDFLYPSGYTGHPNLVWEETTRAMNTRTGGLSGNPFEDWLSLTLF